MIRSSGVGIPNTSSTSPLGKNLRLPTDLKINEALVAQQTIPQNSAFQIEYLDTYDSECDDLSSAKVILMAHLSSYDSDVLSEVPYTDSYPNDMLNQDVQEMTYTDVTPHQGGNV
ncbi:hypothetical protein Tco_0994647, partial [Tanacetum coccineum]